MHVANKYFPTFLLHIILFPSIIMKSIVMINTSEEKMMKCNIGCIYQYVILTVGPTIVFYLSILSTIFSNKLLKTKLLKKIPSYLICISMGMFYIIFGITVQASNIGFDIMKHDYVMDLKFNSPSCTGDIYKYSKLGFSVFLYDITILSIIAIIIAIILLAIIITPCSEPIFSR